MAGAYRANIVIPSKLKARIEAQMDFTGESMSEFIRRCLLQYLEATEAKQAEIRVMEQAVANGLTAN